MVWIPCYKSHQVEMKTVGYISSLNLKFFVETHDLLPDVSSYECGYPGYSYYFNATGYVSLSGLAG